jgi:hypothetical protein
MATIMVNGLPRHDDSGINAESATIIQVSIEVRKITT